MAFSLDLDKIADTDELQTYFPHTENERWEYKDAALLQKKNVSHLEKELAVQASAFANTRSGLLVFGYPDDDCTSPQPCERLFGTEPMEHWLEKKIHMSVDPPLESFHVRAISITGKPAEVVYVVSFQRSPLAPHQSQFDSHYYWRIGANSMPAPHSYLELLWNQTTKAVLKLTDVTIGIGGRTYDEHLGYKSDLAMSITLLVRNVSLMCATNWGVHYRVINTSKWSRMQVALSESGSLRPPQDHLLPDEQAQIPLTLHNIVATPNERTRHLANVLRELGTVTMEFRPVSHNFIGEAYMLNLSEPQRQQEMEHSLRNGWPQVFG